MTSIKCVIASLRDRRLLTGLSSVQVPIHPISLIGCQQCLLPTCQEVAPSKTMSMRLMTLCHTCPAQHIFSNTPNELRCRYARSCERAVATDQTAIQDAEVSNHCSSLQALCRFSAHCCQGMDCVNCCVYRMSYLRDRTPISQSAEQQQAQICAKVPNGAKSPCYPIFKLKPKLREVLQRLELLLGGISIIHDA